MTEKTKITIIDLLIREIKNTAEAAVDSAKMYATSGAVELLYGVETHWEQVTTTAEALREVMEEER